MPAFLKSDWCRDLLDRGNFLEHLAGYEKDLKKWKGVERILFTHELLLPRNQRSEMTRAGPAYVVGEAAFLSELNGLLYGAFWLGRKEDSYFCVGDIPQNLLVVPGAMVLGRVIKRILKEHGFAKIVDDDLDLVGKQLPPDDVDILVLTDTLTAPHRVCVRTKQDQAGKLFDCICTYFPAHGLNYAEGVEGKYIRSGDYVFKRDARLHRTFLECSFPGGSV